MSHTEPKTTAAIYCRVSTRKQAEEGYRIGEQERMIREYCMKQGYEVYKVFPMPESAGKTLPTGLPYRNC